MSIENELQELNELLVALRDCVYSEVDEPFVPRGEYIVSEPSISSDLTNKIEEKLRDLSEKLGSSYFEELAEYFSYDSNIRNYVNFDEVEFQMEHIQNDPEAYDEGLAAAQQVAAELSYERKSALWDEALEDVKYILEEVYPNIF